LNVVADGVSGLIASVDDPNTLADAFRRLITDPDLRRRIGRAAADSVANLNLETVAADWEVVLGFSA
jgi:glycosyltransferase involved in cell wall biosynthesis